MRRPRILIAGLVSAAVVAAGAVSLFHSNPVEAATVAEQGQLLAPLWDDQQHPFTTVGVSSAYFAYQQDPWSGETDHELKTFDLSDGHVVTETPVTPVGRYLVKRLSTDSAGGWGYEYLDPSTLASLGTVNAQGTTLCLHELGVVFRVTADTDTHTHLWVQQPDGAKRELASLPVTSTASFECVDQDERYLLVKTDTDLRLIDVQTGTSKTVAAVSPEWAALTPGRVFWRTSASATGQQVAWAGRSGQETGTVDVPFTEAPQTLGDDLLVLHKTADYQFEVRRIAASDGAVGAPLLTDARGGTALDDGTFLVGRVSSIDQLAASGSRRQVMAIPRARERAWDVGMSGDRVVASWSDSSDQPFNNIPLSETTTTAAGAEWASLPGTQRPDESFQVAGDVTATVARHLPNENTDPPYVVRWPGGSREIPAVLYGVHLGRGGRLLTAFRSGVGDVLQDVRTGAEYGTVDARQTAMDGTWVWTRSDSTGTLSGRDVSTGQTKTVQTSIPAYCGIGLQVAGRWAVACGVVVDLLGVVPDRKPTAGTPASWALGDGYIASVVAGQAPELLVTDLNDAAAPNRSLGAVSTGSWRDRRRIIAEAGSGDLRFAYIDNAEQVRVAKVDWLKPAPPTTPAPPADTTAPTLFRISAGDRARMTSAVTLNFSYRDNLKLGSYDVVYKTAPAGASLGKWVFPPAWQNMTTTSVSLNVGAGTDTCFMTRARDAAGNLSVWSPVICTSLPLDDRSLSIVGSVTRASTAMGIYGTGSRLNKADAGLYRVGQVGNRIAVVGLSGPGQGAVDVYHAGYKLGHISLAATSWSRKVYYLPVTPYRSGTVSIVSTSPAYAWIDGFTALRY